MHPVAFALVLLLAAVPARALGDSLRASPTDGLRWSSADGQLALHAGGVFAAELVIHDSDNHSGSGLRTDLAKPILEASYGDAWRLRISGDLEGTKTASNLYEAFVSWSGVPWLRVSAGLLQLPLGFEAGTRAEDLSLIEHSFSYYLNYRSDWALRVEGELAEGAFEWDLAAAPGYGFDANG